ncbi:hypothetical protein H0H93_012908, partial [Arthromyces matolae]
GGIQRGLRGSRIEPEQSEIIISKLKRNLCRRSKLLLGINTQWKSAGWKCGRSVEDATRTIVACHIDKAGGDAGVEGDPYIHTSTDVPEIDKASGRNKIRLYLENLADSEGFPYITRCPAGAEVYTIVGIVQRGIGVGSKS